MICHVVLELWEMQEGMALFTIHRRLSSLKQILQIPWPVSMQWGWNRQPRFHGWEGWCFDGRFLNSLSPSVPEEDVVQRCIYVTTAWEELLKTPVGVWAESFEPFRHLKWAKWFRNTCLNNLDVLDLWSFLKQRLKHGIAALIFVRMLRNDTVEADCR